jgi:hypothetical protein
MSGSICRVSCIAEFVCEGGLRAEGVTCVVLRCVFVVPMCMIMDADPRSALGRTRGELWHRGTVTATGTGDGGCITYSHHAHVCVCVCVCVYGCVCVCVCV